MIYQPYETEETEIRELYLVNVLVDYVNLFADYYTRVDFSSDVIDLMILYAKRWTN